MGVWLDRFSVVRAFLDERRRSGLPEIVGPCEREILFLLDGVGGFQAAALMVRRALREVDAPIGTILFCWQVPLTGSVLPDLMWLKRNRGRAGALAARIAEVHARYPTAPIHMIAFSGGAGVAVFACEQLPRPPLVETLILACPAMAPEYNLAPALRSVRRCHAWVSRRDRVILGMGTTVFGTTDRAHTFAAGCVGFRLPAGLDDGDRVAYERLEELHWSPELSALGHHGGHTGWGSVAFLREHLIPMLRGRPLLPTKGFGRVQQGSTSRSTTGGAVVDPTNLP